MLRSHLVIRGWGLGFQANGRKIIYHLIINMDFSRMSGLKGSFPPQFRRIAIPKPRKNVRR